MKNIILSVWMVFAASWSFGQFSSGSLTASGLTCSMCTKAIYNALSRVPFVEKVDADIEHSAFALSFKSGSTVDPDALKAAVERAGFSVAHLTLTGSFHNIPLTDGHHAAIGGNLYHLVGVDNAMTLEGTKTLTIVDRRFVSAKDFKRFAANAHPCLESGKREACCPKDMLVQRDRIYHATL